jgi:predicted transcriptional regulator of viral defense system
MVMKHTILSQSDAQLLEQAVLKHGQIAGMDQLDEIFQSVYSCKSDRKRRIALLAIAGWLVRIRRGLYLIVTDLSARGTGNLSNLIISNALNSRSYISFARALNWHGMFDQLTKTVDAITPVRPRSYQFQSMEFRFLEVAEKLFFGFTEQRLDGKIVNIGEIEKVILDYLFLRRNEVTISMIVEKLREYQNKFDFAKMIGYSKEYNITVQRNLGFLLDTIGVSCEALHEMARSNRKGFSKMHPCAKTFNAKWRLYYDPGIIE